MNYYLGYVIDVEFYFQCGRKQVNILISFGTQKFKLIMIVSNAITFRIVSGLKSGGVGS